MCRLNGAWDIIFVRGFYNKKTIIRDSCHGAFGRNNQHRGGRAVTYYDILRGSFTDCPADTKEETMEVISNISDIYSNCFLANGTDFYGFPHQFRY